LAWDSLDAAAFDLGQTAAGFLFPSIINLGIDGMMQCKCQTVHQFGPLFRRPMAGFFNDFIRCDRHGHKLRFLRWSFNAGDDCVQTSPARRDDIANELPGVVMLASVSMAVVS
jgi:hypothetical protein